jgi:hypothetical protein
MGCGAQDLSTANQTETRVEMRTSSGNNEMGSEKVAEEKGRGGASRRKHTKWEIAYVICRRVHRLGQLLSRSSEKKCAESDNCPPGKD